MAYYAEVEEPEVYLGRIEEMFSESRFSPDRSGGYDDDKTGRYTDQFALGVHMDLEKILGWKATEFQFTVTERNRRL